MRKYTLKDEFGLIDLLAPIIIVLIFFVFNNIIESIIYASLMGIVFLWGFIMSIIRYYRLTHYGTMLLQSDCVITHTETKGEIQIIVKYQYNGENKDVKMYKKNRKYEHLVGQNKIDMIIDLNKPQYFHIFM